MGKHMRLAYGADGFLGVARGGRWAGCQPHSTEVETWDEYAMVKVCDSTSVW
jgi:hypothetical protein